MNYTTKVVQVTNVSPSATSEQMRTLFGFLGTIDELKLFPPDDSPMPVTSRVCFVKFQEPESVGVSQHLTNTVFVDRALIVVPFAEGSIPDEAKALSLLAPANAVAGNLPGGGLLPTPLPNAPMGGNPFGVPGLDAMAAFGFPGPNMNPQAADQLFKLMTDPKLNPLAAGLNLSASLKADASNKEIEEAMRRVRETQSLISAAIETGGKDSKRRTRSRTRSKSRRRSSASHSRYRRSSSRQRRRSNSRNRRRSKSPYQKRSRDRNRRSRTRSRDRKKEESSRRRSRTPPKSYSTTRRSHSRNRRRRKSQSISRSPKRKHSRSPSPRRHKKEKKKDKDKEKERDRKTEKDSGREEREQSSKKKKNKDKDKEKEREREREREREKKSEGEKGDTKVTRDYDEEEQGYDSEKEREERKYSDDSALSPQSAEGNGTSRPHKVKANGADNDDNDDNMDVSD